VVFAKGGSDIADPEVRAGHPGYRHVPLRALLSLLALQRLVWRDAPVIAQRLLMVHALQDHTAPVDAARALFARLGAREKRLVLLAESFHVVTVDRERARVLDEVTRFVEALAAGPSYRQP
jgi:carboxylesterase